MKNNSVNHNPIVSPPYSYNQSVSTQDASRLLNFQIQSSNNQSNPLDSIGLNSLRQKKNSTSIGMAGQMNTMSLPPLNLKTLNYHQNNNSIQAIEITKDSNSGQHAQLIQDDLSGDDNNDSPNANRNASKKLQLGKKKRKKVWVPAASLRRIGLDMAEQNNFIVGQPILKNKKEQ